MLSNNEYAGPESTEYETDLGTLTVRRVPCTDQTVVGVSFHPTKSYCATRLSGAQVRDLRRWLQSREADMVERGQLEPEPDTLKLGLARRIRSVESDPHGVQWLAERVYFGENPPEEDAPKQLAYAVLRELAR